MGSDNGFRGFVCYLMLLAAVILFLSNLTAMLTGEQQPLFREKKRFDPYSMILADYTGIQTGAAHWTEKPAAGGTDKGIGELILSGLLIAASIGKFVFVVSALGFFTRDRIYYYGAFFAVKWLFLLECLNLGAVLYYEAAGFLISLIKLIVLLSFMMMLYQKRLRSEFKPHEDM